MHAQNQQTFVTLPADLMYKNHTRVLPAVNAFYLQKQLNMPASTMQQPHAEYLDIFSCTFQVNLPERGKRLFFFSLKDKFSEG